MKMVFYHLSGSLRGRTQYVDAANISFGTGENCSVVFDAAKDSAVRPLHAEVAVEDQTPILRDRSGEGALLVNGRSSLETALKSGDLIQFGDGGPQVRFRLVPEGAPDTKTWSHIVADSRDIVVRTPHTPYLSPLYLARHLMTDIVRYGSPLVRLVAGVSVLAPLVIIVALGVALYHQYMAKGASERKMAELIGRMETGRLTREEMEQRIEQERRSVAELRRQQEELTAKLSASLKDQEAARRSEQEMRKIREQLAALESSQRFAEDIVRRFENSVGLLQGGYGLKEQGTGRPLRYRGFDQGGHPLADKEGNALVTVEGTEPPVVIHYAGTAFLVDETGVVVTNRHMIRMWETFPPAQQAIEAGFEPDVHVLRLFFPGTPEPYNLRLLKVADQADLAALRTERVPAGVVPLTLASEAEGSRTGEPVVVLSYPGSFDSILGRLARPLAEETLRESGEDPVKLAEALSRRRLVRPLATQGHLSNLTQEVLTFEAGSASGSSGSPIFNKAGRVIGVNRGTLRKSGGLNVGIPVRHVRELLAQLDTAPKARRAMKTAPP